MRKLKKGLVFLVLIALQLPIIEQNTTYGKGIKNKSEKRVVFLSKSEKEREAVTKVIESFVSYSRQKKFRQALSYTTDKEYKEYKTIVDAIRLNKGKVPLRLKEYFERLKGYEIEAIELSKWHMKAVVLCKFKFQYSDQVSRDDVRKFREVIYYLKKVREKGVGVWKYNWKIMYSKLLNESYYYSR